MKISTTAIKSLGKVAKKFVSENSPTIFAGLGIAFGLGSVAFAVKGTVKSYDQVKNKESAERVLLNKKEVVKLVWKNYIPTVALSAASVACIISSVHISARRLTIMAAAYATSNDSFKEYKEKAHELLGDKKEEEIRSGIDSDIVKKTPPTVNHIHDAVGGGVLCLDKYSGQYFYSDADTIKKVVNHLNNLMLHDFYVSLNDLYTELGIEQCKFGDDFGWNVREGDLIEAEFTTQLSEDDTPILVLDYTVSPFPNYRNYL